MTGRRPQSCHPLAGGTTDSALPVPNHLADVVSVRAHTLAGFLSDRASLHLHGSSFGSPVSEAHFRKLTSQPAHGVVVHGRYDNSRIGELLADLDAVIMPSVWFENEPLTIQEAQIAGVPVITGNQGGMAELVRDGIDGRLFQIGDSADLRRVLLELIAEPQRLQAMRACAPEVPAIEAQARHVRQAYVHTIATNQRLS